MGYINHATAMTKTNHEFSRSGQAWSGEHRRWPTGFSVFVLIHYIIRRSTGAQPTERLKTWSAILRINLLPSSNLFLGISFWFSTHEFSQKQQRMKMLAAFMIFLPLKQISFLIFQIVHKTTIQPIAKRCLSIFCDHKANCQTSHLHF